MSWGATNIDADRDMVSALVRLNGVPIVKDPNVPLVRREDDGTETPALCWFAMGRILVHPDRWGEFLRWLPQG